MSFKAKKYQINNVLFKSIENNDFKLDPSGQFLNDNSRCIFQELTYNLKVAPKLSKRKIWQYFTLIPKRNALTNSHNFPPNLWSFGNLSGEFFCLPYCCENCSWIPKRKKKLAFKHYKIPCISCLMFTQ